MCRVGGALGLYFRETIPDARDRSHISHVQVKHPTHCTIQSIKLVIKLYTSTSFVILLKEIALPPQS